MTARRGRNAELGGLRPFYRSRKPDAQHVEATPRVEVEPNVAKASGRVQRVAGRVRREERALEKLASSVPRLAR